MGHRMPSRLDGEKGVGHAVIKTFSCHFTDARVTVMIVLKKMVISRVK